jgi:hypothetical protein
MTRRLFFLLLALSLTGIAAWASPKDDDYTRLARLSYVEGIISYQHSADVEWSTASINLPLEPGDRIYTGPDGKAEIEFDDGSVYRLARNTDIEILSLSDNLFQLRVLVGFSTLEVSGDTDFEIDTPAAAFNTLRKGIYRFNVGENGDSEAVVRKGKLEAANNHFSRRIDSGEIVRVASSETGNPEFAKYDRRDEWDEWNDRRDADLYVYNDRRYLPDDVYMGASGLQQYGHWIDDDTYGSAWVPYYVDVSWSPYSIGRWCYRPAFGWTWISYEPWGWLPYHYGRWYNSPVYGWCWIPGPAFAFNFWSPGLVAFYNGPGWISWCPLGPGDYYSVNNYHYRRGIYAQQLEELRHLNTRAPGNLFHRNERGVFHTVSTAQFQGGVAGRGITTERIEIDQPWNRGELVKERLSIQPTAASFRAVPDRQAIQPPRAARALPSVVRNNPGLNLRGQEQFSRITNPQIPALPSRSEKKQSDQTAPNTGRVSRSSPRGNEAPQGERTTPVIQNPAGNVPAEQGGRTIATPRTTGTSRGSIGNSGPGASTAPATRPDRNPPSTQRSTPVWRYDGRPPQQQQAPQTPDATTPRNDGQQNNRGEPPSERGRQLNSSSRVIAVPAPKPDSSTTNVAPRQSNTAPPPNRSGGNQAPPSAGKSSGGAASSHDSGGGAQKAPERNSSGGEGGRK